MVQPQEVQGSDLYTQYINAIRKTLGFRGASLALLLVCLLLASCGGPELQPLSLNAAPWGAGEISQYKVTDVNGVVAGTARYDITAGESQTNPNGWTIRREIAAQGDNEIAAVEVKADLSPKTSVLIRTGTQGQQIVKATYLGSEVAMELTSQAVTTVQNTSVPSDVYDEYMLWQLGRALPLAEGYATQLNTFHTVTGEQNRVTVQVLKAEEVTVPARTYTTWQVEFTLGTRKTTAWFTQDERHTLVKYVDGRNGATFELTDYQPGE